MSEQEIIETYGKSIWDMSAQELVEYHLEETWVEIAEALAWWAESEEDDE